MTSAYDDAIIQPWSPVPASGNAPPRLASQFGELLMKRYGSVPFALFATLALAWSIPAFATGNCANGKTIYNKKVGGVDISCSQASCHGPSVNKNNITNAANNPGLIDQYLDSQSEMSG